MTYVAVTGRDFDMAAKATKVLAGYSQNRKPMQPSITMVDSKPTAKCGHYIEQVKACN